jgi:major membrane immunogen (membrane-anchored lipoprotein)
MGLMVGCGKKDEDTQEKKGPGNQSAYQENSKNCSSEFVSSYNAVLLSVGQVQKEPTSSYNYEKAQKDINAFDGKYHGVFCSADANVSSSEFSRYSSSYKPQIIDISVNAKVEEWNKYLFDVNKLKTDLAADSEKQTQVSSAAVSMIEDHSRDVDLSTLKDGITVEVLDESFFQKSLTSFLNTTEVKNSIQRGELLELKEVNRDEVFCFLKTDHEILFNKSERLKFEMISINEKVFSMKSADSDHSKPFMLICARVKNYKNKWLVSDLDKASLPV